MNNKNNIQFLIEIMPLNLYGEQYISSLDITTFPFPSTALDSFIEFQRLALLDLFQTTSIPFDYF